MIIKPHSMNRPYPANCNYCTVFKNEYNCGGYALGIYKWYIIGRDRAEAENIFNLIDLGFIKEAYNLAKISLIEEFNLLEIDENEVRENRIDYRKNEIIAFCFETSSIFNDFHFWKLNKHGVWVDKQGGFGFSRHQYEDVFDIWNDRYDGKILFFMRERK